MPHEYLTTTKAVADFYDPVGKRHPQRQVRPPEGEGWDLVNTAANDGTVFYTWRRLKKEQDDG